VVLASDLNTHLRDNLNVTAPAVLTTAGDILYASGANTPARLAKSTTSTQYLANTGSSNIPAWNEVALGTGVSGTLPVGNGGTGATTLTANGALVGNGTSAIASVDMSTKGGLLAGDGSGNPSVLAVGGTGGHVLTVDSGETTGLKWAASGAGGTSFEGSQTTEATTTSETPTDLLTLASISIAVTVPFFFQVNARKTSGSTGGVSLGLKINSTVVGEAINEGGGTIPTQTASVFQANRAGNEAASGLGCVQVGPQVSNYLRSLAGFMSDGSASGKRAESTAPGQTANMPSATVTSIIMRGDVPDMAITCGADELFAYERATS